MDPLNEAVPGTSIRVFLLIESRLLREALFRLFRKRSEILVVGQDGQAEGEVRWLPDTPCDVLVIDSYKPTWLTTSIVVESGAQAALRVILIEMESDEEQFMTAVRSGVMGYLLKDASAAEVVAAVRAVSQGQAVCPPELCASLFHFAAQANREMTVQSIRSRPDLTLRQQKLIGLVAKGLTNKEIASLLNLSEFTVKNHIHRIMKQVDADTRSEAVHTIRAHGFAIS